MNTLKLAIRFLVFAAAFVFFIIGCSTKKDAFVNRNWHALNTKYNVLYNGNIAFETGRQELHDSYFDDYWAVLPIERLKVTDEVKLDSEDNNPNFERAEEKATKAIQKHSMDIKDVERNPQTDEAFLLLGKARYFDQRYIPALEAFNYVLKKYIESDKLNEATIWREKTNMRLDNPEVAIKNLKRLFKYEELKDQEIADANAVLAQCYVNLKAPDTAIQKLKYAQAYTKSNEEKGRYLFVIGQLYNQLGFKDSANYAFDKVIALNRRTPRVYHINAHLQKINNEEVTPETKDFLYEYLTDLEENRENRSFLDKIYHQKALFHMAADEDSLGIAYFNKSLRASQQDKKLNARNYENLANYYFDEKEYKASGKYYDSVLPNLVENSRKHRAISKKLTNLEDVIKYEDIVHYADSVITLYEMPEQERISYFEDVIAELKAKEAAEEEKKQKQAEAGFATFNESQGGKQNSGKFYFYNITSLGYGKTDFKTRWGNRELADDWRWSDKSRIAISEATGDIVVDADGQSKEPTEEEKYSVDFYLAQVPNDEKVIDSLYHERNFAFYQLGLIYKEKFKENELAADRLQKVLDNNPEERLILPAKYNLYKIFEEGDNIGLADQMKQNIITNHADSRYAEILLNPQAVFTGNDDGPDAKYNTLFKAYRDQRFLEVITRSQDYINQFTGDPIVPKFEMLKANAIGRLQGFEPFKEALNYVALTYPNNPEGKKAEDMVANQLPKLANKEFSLDSISKGTKNWKVVFTFDRRSDEKAEKLKKRLEEVIKDLRYKNIVSKDIYDLEIEFVVVHGFKGRDFALGFSELIKKNKDYLIKDDNFVISSTNYQTIQVHKNFKEYQEQLLTPKL